MWFLCIETEVIGVRNIPQGSCLFLFNHTSTADIFALKAAVKPVKFGAKIELFQIPIFGHAMQAAGMIPIARGNREKVIRVYERTIERTKLGEQFALAPEGKRNFLETLLPFKTGPFAFAIQAQIPVVPVVILGAHGIWPKNSLLPRWDRWSQNLSIEFFSAIPSRGLHLDDRQKLMGQVREIMAQRLPKDEEKDINPDNKNDTEALAQSGINPPVHG